MGTFHTIPGCCYYKYFFICFTLCYSEEVTGENQELTSQRSKRLFFVSTTSTTSTILTGSYCYMSTNVAVVTCKRRRKRNLADEAKISDNSELDISPQRQQESENEDDMEEKTDNSEISSGLSQTDARDAKVLLYWLTTTSVVKTTKFSRKQTLASVACTPSSWTMSEC